MAIDEAFAVKLLRLAKTMYDRRAELERMGVAVRGLGQEEELLDLLLDEVGAPKDGSDERAELWEELHDTMYQPDGVRLNTSDEGFLLAWRTVVAAVRGR